MKDDPLCPPGHRFLIQFPDENDLNKARATLASIFSQAIADAAMFVKGSTVPVNPKKRPYTGGDTWVAVETGVRVYIPKNVHV